MGLGCAPFENTIRNRCRPSILRSSGGGLKAASSRRAAPRVSSQPQGGWVLLSLVHSCCNRLATDPQAMCRHDHAKLTCERVTSQFSLALFRDDPSAVVVVAADAFAASAAFHRVKPLPHSGSKG